MNVDNPTLSIDQSALDNLKALMKDKFVPLRDSFIKNTQADLAQIRAAIDKGQPAEARFIAHRLGSGAAQFGLFKVTQAARTLELEKTDTLAPLCQALETAFAHVLPVLQNTK